MTAKQILYIHLIKRPIGFLGALVGLALLSPIWQKKFELDVTGIA